MAQDPDDPGTADLFETAKTLGELREKVPRARALSPVKKRLIETAARAAEFSQREMELGYLHTVLCQTSMPYRSPGADVRVWERRNGAARLQVQAGYALNPQTDEFVEVPLPWGPKVRLVLIYLNAEALRNNSPVVETEDSMTGFFKLVLGAKPTGRELNSLKDQLAALSAATIRMGVPRRSQGVTLGATTYTTQVISTFDLWFPKDPDQRILWPSQVEFSHDYWQSLQNHAVPLVMEQVRALSHSAMAMDIYCWLAQRLCRIGPDEKVGVFVPWGGENGLHQQFGHGYNHINKFRQVFREALKQVCAVYPAAKVGEELDQSGMPLGLRLERSDPPVPRR